MDPDEHETERSARSEARRHRLGGWALRGLLGLGLVMLGLAGGLVWSERRAAVSGSARGGSEPSGGVVQGGTAMPAMPGMPAGHRPDAGAAAKDDEPVEVSLTPEAVERAGIKTAVVRIEASASMMTVPGTVTSNAYRDTKVNALVGGIVRRVGVELGQAVGRGQALAVIFSSELADAQMKYLSMQAMFVADHQKLDRTEKLAAIGAASRQELEEIIAVHHAHETELAAARQRLLLLGFTS
jgi:multidrug efflux pump subunit AcrA (membrane-fusion protein)